MGECKETRKFCRALEAQGAATYPAVASEMSPLGWPDRFIGHRRWTGWVEFKAWAGRVSGEQETQLGRLRAASVPAYVVRFSEDWSQLRLEDPDGTVRSGWVRWGLFFDEVTELV